jgi:hypothetical protein
MRAVNHALTGAIIGLAVPTPWLALPLAVVSHFVCDAIPHSGGDDSTVASKRFALLLLADALLCIGVVTVLGFSGVQGWLLAAVCAFLATAPDALWLPGYIRARRGQTMNLRENWFMRLAKDIQWFERPIGAVVEVAWFIAAGAVLFAFVVA